MASIDNINIFFTPTSIYVHNVILILKIGTFLLQLFQNSARSYVPKILHALIKL